MAAASARCGEARNARVVHYDAAIRRIEARSEVAADGAAVAHHGSCQPSGPEAAPNQLEVLPACGERFAGATPCGGGRGMSRPGQG